MANDRTAAKPAGPHGETDSRARSRASASKVVAARHRALRDAIIRARTAGRTARPDGA
jgi:hypothetical protein